MDHNWDDHEAHQSTQATRRRLLRAAGGFALAASGLFLSTEIDEAEAREGALGGAKGGRRGGNHRGRDKDHHRRKRRDNRKAPGSGGNGQPLLDVTMIVYNFRSAEVQVQAWQDRPDPRLDDPWYMRDASWDWSTILAKPASGLTPNKDFFGDQKNMAIRIGADRVVLVNGGPGEPAGYILSGGWEGKWGWSPVGQYLATDGSMRVGDAISASGITLSRHRDSAGHMNFLVDLT